MSIYSMFVHMHSGLRWLAMIFILIAIVISAMKLSGRSTESKKVPVFDRLAFIFMHLQLLIGLVLYFISPKVIFNSASMKDSLLRFFLIEHIALMIIAVILITIGYVKSRKAEGLIKRNKLIVIYYAIAFILILVAIPWPFRGLGAGWF